MHRKKAIQIKYFFVAFKEIISVVINVKMSRTSFENKYNIKTHKNTIQGFYKYLKIYSYNSNQTVVDKCIKYFFSKLF